MKKKIALIFGITGMDGSHLADLLLEKNYIVHGIIRRSSSFNTGRIEHIFSKLKLHYGDITDSICIDRLIKEIKPDEIYHLAAQSHVLVSFETPMYTGQVDALGTLSVLETVKNNCPNAKVYFAATSELFGKVQEIPQTETTPFYPRSPYGVAKLYSYWICQNYKEAYDLFISCGILFNHTSKRRGSTFICKKICNYILKFNKDKNIDSLKLGNLNAKRDFGYAPEYVYGMWLILQQELPDNFVLATGETHSIREVCEIAFKEIGIDLIWKGKGLNEKGIDKNTKKILIEIDPRYFRPSEVSLLLGCADKAKKILKWSPTIKFKELIQLMIRDK